MNGVSRVGVPWSYKGGPHPGPTWDRPSNILDNQPFWKPECESNCKSKSSPVLSSNGFCWFTRKLRICVVFLYADILVNALASAVGFFS